MTKFLITVLILANLFFVVSCGSKTAETEKTAETKSEGEGADEHANPNTATLTNEQIESIGVELGVIEQKQLTAAVKANGVLKVPNQNKASVNSIYSGVIK